MGILFSESDLYKRKDKANQINHKEYVAYVGNVDTFRILIFSKEVELEYWKYRKIVFISDGANYLIALRCYQESGHWSEIEKIVVDYLNQ